MHQTPSHQNELMQRGSGWKANQNRLYSYHIDADRWANKAIRGERFCSLHESPAGFKEDGIRQLVGIDKYAYQ